MIGGLAALAAVTVAALPTARADDAETWALLKKPGHIVLLRHANAPEQPPDADKIDFKDCKTQRNLDEVGRTQAKHVGDEFRKHGIASVRIYSSQYCRAIETAKLTRLGAAKEYPALNQTYLADLTGMKEAGDKARALMRTIPAHQLTMLVTHVPNIQAIAGVLVSSGEFAVVHMDASGSVVVDGRIKVP
jgi:phosphohistidine phosphatase SixA